MHPTSRSQTPNYYSTKNNNPNNDEVYSPHMNLNDSSQYVTNPSTSISLVPISNNVSVVSSSKPAIQKSTIKRWGGTASENLHQQSQPHSRTSTPSNADNYYQSPPSSASHRTYMMSSHNNHIQGVIPPLSNVPISSDIPQPVPLSAIDKKLNENHLVNNNAKIKAYVINSAYSNAIVTPSGMNNLKEKLSAMAYMNDDNPEQDNPLNVMPNGRRKSNTSVPSSAKSQVHQSSQSIDHKNFSLSKKKIIEKLNE
ncbi:hypothetical protein H8356DRAFT_145859 [Neocallimastix lanati (nom. inval.)]|jgi:hypothetical protein|uniref:Uncharacterized protein n=1 Tax=Neocallimastix californiae TaxID=1754190 RepID=A0A1Y2CFW3_9FUNG|nr:hypothetical protein H8356DRAFT_145859 [Neocallimastix sp. JGI-2020a]ORY45816.1 hypothetical protein LY90DRAFT_18753 [Neocallimastix californiae]|eukprot:ORY45816.1 hypothetical protein LY90DRAFT_18753 [Neocallimastix californiae]